MGKVIQIEVPDEIVKLLEENPKSKNRISQEFVNKILYDEMLMREIDKELLDLLAGEEDTLLENEEETLKKLREKERSRIRI